MISRYTKEKVGGQFGWSTTNVNYLNIRAVGLQPVIGTASNAESQYHEPQVKAKVSFWVMLLLFVDNFGVTRIHPDTSCTLISDWEVKTAHPQTDC